MRPRVKPALRRILRDDRTLQYGVHPRRAVVLSELAPEVRRWIDGLDGTRDLRQVVRAAARAGLDESGAHSLIDQLLERGVVDDATACPRVLSGLRLGERDRLRPELDALAVASRGADGGRDRFARRRRAQVRVYGAGRVGAQVVALLAASGVGSLSVADPGLATPADLVPGGLGWSEEGASRAEGAVAVARRAGPVHAWVAGSHLSDGSPLPDLVVLAPVGPLDLLLVRELAGVGVPHLLAAAFEGYGTAGPLVIPGETACLSCLDLFRRDHDPGWPLLTARLGGYPPGEVACSAALATMVAASAAGHALAFLDGDASLVTNGTMDVMPDWRCMRRSVGVHEQCRCFRNDRASLTMVGSAREGLT
ncbi:thiamine biosynthesis protein ThiF [Nonomuraea sp. NPDC050310]|uniref:thiamine biosynthesis protein ThiF n=1 Tax=unclassified Nonomuraea TaxID=2593643 RepID=UPI0033E6B05B